MNAFRKSARVRLRRDEDASKLANCFRLDPRRTLSKSIKERRSGPLLTLQRFRLRAPPQMQRLSTLMWQSVDLGRPEGAASRFTATSGSMSLLPLPGFGS